MSLVVSRFAAQGQVVCIPTLQGNSSAVLGALGSGCTVVGVDEDQSIIDDVVRVSLCGRCRPPLADHVKDQHHGPDSGIEALRERRTNG